MNPDAPRCKLAHDDVVELSPLGIRENLLFLQNVLDHFPFQFRLILEYLIGYGVDLQSIGGRLEQLFCQLRPLRAHVLPEFRNLRQKDLPNFLHLG